MNSNHTLKKTSSLLNLRFALLVFISICSFQVNAQTLYVVNGTGYTTFYPELQTAIESNGYTVTVGTTLPATPSDYDYIALFGNVDRSSLETQLQTYVNGGGNLFIQYEISCCTPTQGSVASIASTITGLNITVGNDVFAPDPYTISDPFGEGCGNDWGGALFHNLNGIPAANGIIPNGVSGTQEAGFYFNEGDPNLPAGSGFLIGLGDINLFFVRDTETGEQEPSTEPVNHDVVDMLFPGAGDCSPFAVLAPCNAGTEAPSFN